MREGKPTLLGVITGAVAGLVAITPACGSVNAAGALGVGVGASALAYFAVSVAKVKFGYDDSLDVFGVHGVGGTWGALATGLFIADFALPEGVTRGAQVFIQVKSILFTAAFAPLATLAILYVLKLIFGNLRLDEEAEFAGVDLSEHSETAYVFGAASGTAVMHHSAGEQAAHVGIGVTRPA
jgi:Amt family ammonium transporter